jgi:hypothetical protein
MRPLCIGLGSLLIALAFVVAAAGGAPRRTVDLDAPGVVDDLRHSRPTHFEAVRQILRGVRHRSDAEVPRWMEVNFGARDVSYVPISLTSHPPRRRLAFALDDTWYETVITLTHVRLEVVPLR